jgi:putative phosphoesterase
MTYTYNPERYGTGPTAGSADPVPLVRVGSVAFASDIHANVPAFEAVLAALEAEPVDALVLNGDITWGTYPTETADLIRAARERFAHVILIRGNGDRAVLELADGMRPAERPREGWMLAAHRPPDIELLRGVVFQVDIEVAGLGVIRSCHDSPRADIETITPGTPIERLVEATAGVAADTLLTGHTHLQFRRPVAGLPGVRLSVNPGSVGIPYGGSTPGARWLRVDPRRDDPFDFRVSGYDIDAYIDGMLRTDDPGRETIVKLLRQPPTMDEIIADAEGSPFQD